MNKLMKGFTIYLVELPVPDDMDPSTLLERATSLAIDLAEEFAPEDDDAGEAFDPAMFDDHVSVQVKP